MNVLVLGGGGREHALAWRLGLDPAVKNLVSSPGNPGISIVCRCVPVDLLAPEAVLALADAERADLTVVGPEAPLERGLADLFRAKGRAILGPPRAGAMLECSKVEAKHFMARHRIPTARFVVVDEPARAFDLIERGELGWPVVIKADGLAAGKGVVIAADLAEARAAVQAAMVDRAFGAAGARLVLEECLVGPEVSAFFLCDGVRALPMSSAQDHKRIFDDDQGPNTGGMGAFAPSPLLTPDLAAFTATRIVEPVLEGMREAGSPYVGFLYVSLMLTPDGPKVIEFNARFGDPEAQVVLPAVEGAFAEPLFAAARGQLEDRALSWSSDRFVGVVLASRGYPASSKSGQPIEGLVRAAAVPNALVFHAGTALRGDQVVTAGGRVLTIVGRGDTYADAMATAYRAASAVSFDGMQFRRDIGRKAVDAERAKE